jgi:hypothetical protein
MSHTEEDAVAEPETEPDPFALFPDDAILCIETETQTIAEDFPEHFVEDWEFNWQFYVESSTEKSSFASIPGPKKTKTMLTQTEAIVKSAGLPFFEMRDKQFIAYTCVNRTVIEFLLHRVGDSFCDSRSLTRANKLVLVLVKLKSNVNFINLACIFDVSQYSVKAVFVQSLYALYEAVKRFVVWFNRPTIQARMPVTFKGLFPRTRAIIDASEVECTRPPFPKMRVKMYSHYKSSFTTKYLVACAPSGEITFVSKGFGGRTTDTELTVRSGFLNLIEPGDTVMADKGFPSIEARLLEAGGLLVMPPFKRGQKHLQFSNKDDQDCYQVAKVRIHVERVIERMKRFQILDYVRADMRDHFDTVLVIVSSLCNLSNDIIRQ